MSLPRYRPPADAPSHFTLPRYPAMNSLAWTLPWIVTLSYAVTYVADARGQAVDLVGDLQDKAATAKQASWGHWGPFEDKYSSWTNHSNRLIPVYTLGGDLASFKGKQSAYRDPERLRKIFGYLPTQTVNPEAEYFDQTDLYRLQMAAVEAGKKYIFLVVFDGMDWDTTRAASIYRSQKVSYTSGRGSGLFFQDYQASTADFGLMVTAPHSAKANVDVNAQAVIAASDKLSGYDPLKGGSMPWTTEVDLTYLIGKDRDLPHTFTDSASSATSMCSGIKTYNAAINFAPSGEQVEPIGRTLQQRGWKVGIVTSVPISHATPACAYANNVTRSDYQDISRDLLGLPSASHRAQPLPGADLVLGAGWGVHADKDNAQGDNFMPGNRYLADADLRAVNVDQGGQYTVAQRTAGQLGNDVLNRATSTAIAKKTKLLGYFGTKHGHLPYQTADGKFNPVKDVAAREAYTLGDVEENPTLAELTKAGLRYLESSDRFWMMLEPGDVDWANHSNNLDNAIGAVLSGDDAVREVVQWIESKNAWDQSLVIVTADHGHLLVIREPSVLTGK